MRCWLVACAQRPPNRRIADASECQRGPTAPQSRRPTEPDKHDARAGDEINYDYNNERVSAVGNVQIYYNGATIEADKVIYDQNDQARCTPKAMCG